jgi:hypothetical protein
MVFLSMSSSPSDKPLWVLQKPKQASLDWAIHHLNLGKTKEISRAQDFLLENQDIHRKFGTSWSH